MALLILLLAALVVFNNLINIVLMTQRRLVTDEAKVHSFNSENLFGQLVHGSTSLMSLLCSYC